jgi:hypothetical protein
MHFDVQEIVTLMAGGALAQLSSLGGQAVRDAYSGLKQILVDVYGFAKSHLIEADPKNEATLREAQAALSPAAIEDPRVIAAADRLQEALKNISPERWLQKGVVIEWQATDHDFRAGSVSAGRRGVLIRFVRAGGDIVIGDIEG